MSWKEADRIIISRRVPTAMYPNMHFSIPPTFSFLNEHVAKMFARQLLLEPPHVAFLVSCSLLTLGTVNILHQLTTVQSCVHSLLAAKIIKSSD